MRRSLLPAVLSLSLLLSAVATTYAASYTFTTFAAPGARYTAANGINTAGQVVGVFQDTQGANYGFLKDGDTYTIINVPNVPGAVFTEPRGINDNGQIVGWFSDAGVLHGFLKDGAMFTTFDVPGPGGVNTGTKFTFPHSINNAGQIVGWFRDASGVDHGFLKEGGDLHPDRSPQRYIHPRPRHQRQCPDRGMVPTYRVAGPWISRR